MVRIGPLSDEQRDALEQVRRRAVGRVSQRVHMVLLSARGYAVEQVAAIFGVGEDVVRKWLRRYERQGPRGLDDRPRRAGPRRTAWPGRSWTPRRATRRATTGSCRVAGRSGCWRRSWARVFGWSCPGECPSLPAPGRLALGAAPAGPGDPCAAQPTEGGPGGAAQAGAAGAGGRLGRHPPVSR